VNIKVEFNEAAFDHRIEKEDIMPRMTVEEARAFNDYFINNTITLGPNGSGWLYSNLQNRVRLLQLM